MTDDDPADEGGDPACWLDRVCPECGAVIAGDAVHHTWCGSRRQPGGRAPDDRESRARRRT